MKQWKKKNKSKERRAGEKEEGKESRYNVTQAAGRE